MNNDTKFTAEFTQEELNAFVTFLGDVPMKYAEPVKSFVLGKVQPVENGQGNE